jgi:protein-S-isoprenylcysteine O-methyltransferase Ste14
MRTGRVLEVVLLGLFVTLAVFALTSASGVGGLAIVVAGVVVLAALAVALAHATSPQAVDSQPRADNESTARQPHAKRRTLILHPWYGALVVLLNVIPLGTLGWWASIGVIPFDAAVVYAFFWPGVRSAERP